MLLCWLATRPKRWFSARSNRGPVRRAGLGVERDVAHFCNRQLKMDRWLTISEAMLVSSSRSLVRGCSKSSEITHLCDLASCGLPRLVGFVAAG